MNKQKKILIIILAIVLIALVVLFTLRSRNSKDEFKLDVDTNQIQDGDIVDTSSPVNPPEGASSSNTGPEYKELVKKANESYIAGNYAQALDYLNQALKLETNDRIYMSLYGVHLALKNYPAAEKAIKTSIDLDGTIPSKWIDYANLENDYMKVSFEKVSSIYENALIATKNNINIVTNYASYLQHNGKKEEAIKMWQRAIEIKPESKAMYQAEIDALNK